MAGQRSGRASRCATDNGTRRSFLSGTAVALGALPALVAASEAEPLDEAFLEYLAEFAAQEDDWAWFNVADERTEAAPVKETQPAKPVAAPQEKVNP